MAQRQDGESKDILIKHLRVELEDLRASSRKMEDLNAASIALENNYKTLKSEKEKMEVEGQTKTVSILEGIREAEQESKKLRTEYLENEKQQIDLVSQMERRQAELDMLEQKEQTFDSKLNDMNRTLEDTVAVKDNASFEIDAKKRELAELRARLQTVEKDQTALDERISKMRLDCNTQKTSMIDLEAERKRLEQQRQDRLNERERLTSQYNANDIQFGQVTSKLSSLEERKCILEAEMKKLQISSKELEIKRLEEENNRESIMKDINHKEGNLKELNDGILAERDLKIRAGSSVNDLREVNEGLYQRGAKLQEALNRVSSTYTQVIIDYG